MCHIVLYKQLLIVLDSTDTEVFTVHCSVIAALEHGMQCRDFINSRLDIAQCIQFLLQGLQYSDEQLQEDCIALFARSEPLTVHSLQL